MERWKSARRPIRRPPARGGTPPAVPRLPDPPPEPLPQVAERPLLRYGGWAGSLTIHAAILLLSLATIGVARQMLGSAERAQIMPDPMIVENAPVAAIPSLSGTPDPVGAAARMRASSRSGERVVAEATALRGAEAAGAMIGLSVRAESGSAGASAPFGVPTAADAAPRATFMGSSGNARRIIYICDASGGIVGRRFEAIKAELMRSVAELKPIQSVNVILFNEQRPLAMADELLPANERTRERLAMFLESYGDPGRGSDPLPSLRFAFDQKPDLIYLLTDGEFTSAANAPDPDAAVIRELRAMNADRHVRINTIAYAGSEQGKYLATLRQIAADSGGVFRMGEVSERP